MAVTEASTQDLVLAAVDIGTNSVHLVVARVGPDGRAEILDREKEMVRLGRTGGDMSMLADDAIDRGIAALRRCRSVADAHGAELAAVATSAVREAENRRVFLDRAYDEAGVSVEVISGFEEARLIHLGVLQSLALYEQRLLLCDIGGGSTEVVVGHQGDVIASRSLRLGAIRLTEQFLAKPKVKAKHIARCRQHIEATFGPFAYEVASAPQSIEIAVGSSGTIETMVAMALAARGEAVDDRTFNAEVLTADEIVDITQLLIDTPDLAARARLDGIDPRRVDILLAGALILEGFVQAFGVDEVTFSDYALREGVLLDQARRRTGGGLHHLRDLRRETVTHLLELMDEHPDHAREVARLTLRLFDELQPALGYDGTARALLEAGALLCNVGVFISHAAHHKHSYYVIRNAEHLAGFTNREIELIAQIARYHRRSAPKPKHTEWAGLRKADRQLVRDMAAILRVGIALDRSHGHRVADVRANVEEFCTGGRTTPLTISLVPRGTDPVDLELHSAELRRDLLETVLDTEVRFVVAAE